MNSLCRYEIIFFGCLETKRLMIFFFAFFIAFLFEQKTFQQQ